MVAFRTHFPRAGGWFWRHYELRVTGAAALGRHLSSRVTGGRGLLCAYGGERRVRGAELANTQRFCRFTSV